MKFKEGDLVKIIKSCSGCEKGNFYYLKKIESDFFGEELYAYAGNGDGCTCDNNWELVDIKDLNLNLNQRSLLNMLKK